MGALCLALPGCGPSVQSIYEGDVRFEHCYRLDLDFDIAPTHREACWKHWLKAYTYGQPRDRIEYARRRVRAFSNGDVTRPLLDEAAVKNPTRQFYLAVPEPTSVHAPPPPIAPKVEPAAPSSSAKAAPPPVEAPADSCTQDCRAAFETCQVPCSGESSAGKGSCKACPSDYKTCMRRCFQ